MPLLDIQNLRVCYDGIAAVQTFSMTIETQEIVALIGANGAGKSSVLRALFDLTKGSADKMFFDKSDIQKLSTRQRVACGMSMVPETRELFPRMTVEDNLKLGLFLKRSESAFPNELERINELFPILRDRLRQRAGTLSGGEQQMLALARALMQKPRLLCLDEPSLGLAPKLVQQVYAMLQKINESGVAILLVEQQARRALKFANRGYVMNVGRVVTEGDCTTLKEDNFVKSAYLGGTPQ
jgi:branched-chain amino acid transport system ATP-binding protein